MIMVDELIAWPQRAKPGAERYFGNGKLSCHLATDGVLDDLHAFARRLGLTLADFQDHPTLAHYDLAPELRGRALHLGAVFIPGRVQARRRFNLPPLPGDAAYWPVDAAVPHA